jgi:hypothetical protein
MNAAASTMDIYLHVRVIIGIILALSISRLLTGLARFIQHPGRNLIFPVHLVWVAFTFLSVLHFWWFEFYLSAVREWTFEIYLFVIFYSSLYFLLCALLFPDDLADYAGYAEYFMSRRKWFFGLITLIFLTDIADTAIKGMDRFWSYGFTYPARNLIYAAVAIAAIFIDDKRAQLVLALLALLFQAFWILRAFSTLS